MARKKKGGSPQQKRLGGLYYDPARAREIEATMKRTEERWASRSGPVVTRKVTDPKPDSYPKGR